MLLLFWPLEVSQYEVAQTKATKSNGVVFVLVLPAGFPRSAIRPLYVRILSQCFRRKCLQGIASNIRVSFQRKKRPLSSMHECRSLSLCLPAAKYY